MAALVEPGKAKAWYPPPARKSQIETQPLTTVGALVAIVDQYSDDLNLPLDKDTAAKVKDGMTNTGSAESHDGGIRKIA